MSKRAKPIPEGSNSITPYLMIRGAEAAIEFYKNAYDAIEEMRMANDDRIGHAELRIGDSKIMLADEYPEMGYMAPDDSGMASVLIHLYVEDVDAVFNKAVSLGAKVLRPVADQFYGDRNGTLRDPFGHVWSIATHQEDLSFEEMEKRAAEQRS